ncbi:MAG TPA: AAA family ATPase [Bryobacteraceae bacterium]|nr:AAA family ATPase [Bryobacteraceae bacterium]
MPKEKKIVFPPFWLDPANEQLWMGLESIPLNHKAYAVLHFLAQRPGRLVTKDELLDGVWPETHVAEGVLKVAVAEVRKALNDVSRSPRFIETVHRRGYRFIGNIESEDRETAPPSSREIEREQSLAQLDSWMAKALEGERQVVFVTGETGMGKTTLVEAFAERIASETETGSEAWIAYGHCLEHFAEGEAYFPVLEALTSLSRQPGRERLIEILRQYAPTWLAQMPSLMDDADRERLKRETLGAAKDRMLREIAEAIEALTSRALLVLILEDLHWSDYSTVDLIGHLARRRGPARLMIVGTFRPAEVIVKQHPLGELKRELQVHRRCSELALEYLSERGIARYLELRFGLSDLPDGLARLIHERTDGNPLFLVNVVEYLILQQQLARHEQTWQLAVPLEEVSRGIPDSLQQLIEQQIQRLTDPERRLLSVASIAGQEFSTRTLSGGIDSSIAEIETCCEDLVRRRQFLRPAKMIQLSDRSLLERYGFIHGLYQHVFYHSVPQPRRVVLHRRIGEFQESAYSDHLEEIAAELSVHFEEGRDYAKAIRYRRLSAGNAAKRYANREALEHLGKALALVPQISERDGAELEAAILILRGSAYQAMDLNEIAAIDFERALVCTRKANDPEGEVKALLKLSAVLFWTEHDRSLTVAERAVELSRKLPDELLQIHARGYCASRRIRLHGWRAEDFEDCLAAVDAARQAGHAPFLGLATMYRSFFESFRSRERDAVRAADEGLGIALELGDSYLYISCQYFKAWALLHLGEWGTALSLIRDGTLLAEKNGHGTAKTVLRMVEARLLLQGFDFAGARELARETLVRAREGFPRFITLIALGEAHLGLGELDRAADCFEEVVARSKAGPFRLDWIFHLPLYRGLSELCIQRGEFDRARDHAVSLCELAAKPGQSTYLALGFRQLAAIALAQENLAEAETQIRLALDTIHASDVPLAASPVFTLAAEIAERRGLLEEAASHRAQARAALQRLTGSMSETEPLRISLLQKLDPPVARAAI